MLVALALLLCLTIPALADTFDRREVQSRLVIAYQVSEAAHRALLPKGWEPIPLNAAIGQNLGLNLTERILAVDAQGKAIGAGRSRDVILYVNGRNPQTNETRVFIVLGYSEPHYGAGPLKVGIPASFESRISSETGRDGVSRIVQKWNVRAQEGGGVQVEAQYRRGAATYNTPGAPAGVRFFSGKDPDHHQIFKQSITAGTLGVPGGRGALIDRLNVRFSGPRMKAIFDGSERVVAVFENEYYGAEVYVP